MDIGGSFETGHTLRELMQNGNASRLFAELEPVPEKERELKLDRPLYLHQEKALKKASKGQSLVVTTGTGSGKTESFLIPVLHHILAEVESGELDSGVRAIIIYPMNALANDQIKRLRALLKNYPAIRFGIYNGNTPHKQSEALSEYRKTHKDANGAPVDPLPNELISREEMQEEPPHILITNYSMLEYMMLRPKDDRVFSGAKLKYIVLDEAHIYKGATGMETSLLMRRLRARISKPDSVQYILTSATLGGPDADSEIVSFSEKLTGVSFSAAGIIRSAEKQPDMLENREIDPDCFSACESAGQLSGTILERRIWILRRRAARRKSCMRCFCICACLPFCAERPNPRYRDAAAPGLARSCSGDDPGAGRCVHQRLCQSGEGWGRADQAALSFLCSRDGGCVYHAQCA